MAGRNCYAVNWTEIYCCLKNVKKKEPRGLPYLFGLFGLSLLLCECVIVIALSVTSIGIYRVNGAAVRSHSQGHSVIAASLLPSAIWLEGTALTLTACPPSASGGETCPYSAVCRTLCPQLYAHRTVYHIPYLPSHNYHFCKSGQMNRWASWKTSCNILNPFSVVIIP